jgi:glycerol-3-phosphate dehydrogenase
LPTRDQQIEALSKTPEYDVLVIGGGATGAGVAVDAGLCFNKSSLLNTI